MNATLSENFTLVCSASGYPVPTIIWTHNGTLVNEDEHDRATITRQLIASRTVISALTVSRAMINDSGDYICSAASSIRDFQPLMAGPATVLVQGNISFIYIYTLCTASHRPSPPHQYRKIKPHTQLLQLVQNSLRMLHQLTPLLTASLWCGRSPTITMPPSQGTGSRTGSQAFLMQAVVWKLSTVQLRWLTSLASTLVSHTTSPLWPSMRLATVLPVT